MKNEKENFSLAEANRRLIKEGSVAFCQREESIDVMKSKREDCFAYLFNDIILLTKRSTGLIIKKKSNTKINQQFYSKIHLKDSFFHLDGFFSSLPFPPPPLPLSLNFILYLLP